MRRYGEIIVVDNDQNDREFLLEGFECVAGERELSNKMVFIDNIRLLNYIKASHMPLFLVISDANMPILDGVALVSNSSTAMSTAISLCLIFS